MLPVVALSLGAAVLALGLSPRSVTPAGAAPTVGGFVLLVVAEQYGLPGAVLALSPFTHLAPVPATAPNGIATLGMCVVAAVLGLIGVAAYGRRDLRG